jgi:hypothetical protein
MSTALAISGVSAVLQYYLYNMYSALPTTMFGSQVSLSAQAPDLVQASFATGTAENQMNLFLHQVTYNAAWRNMQLPSLAADGATLLKSPPLALDLHYLLTAYGSTDWQAEGMLGYALMMLHENPIICRDDITHALTNLSSSNALSTYLPSCGLADQVEMIKITPATLGREEMAWLWTALKADYRPTFPFQVSVVLLQPQKSTSMSIPVLRRSIQAQASPPSQIVVVLPPNGAVAAFSDPVVVTGANLSAMTQVQLTNPRLLVQFTVPLPAANTVVTATTFTFVTNDQTTYPAGGAPAGVYTLVAQVADATGKVVSLSTNGLPFALAPVLPPQTATSAPNTDPAAPNTVVVTINNVTPAVWEGQSVSLSLTNLVPPPPPAPLYSMAVPMLPITGNNNTTLQFVFPNTLPLNVQLLGSLIVDGVSSVVQITVPPLPPGSPPGTPPNPPQYSGPWVTVS